MTVRLSGNGLPRITMLIARQESVEPLIRWLSGAGYPLAELHYSVVEDLHARIPESDVLLIHTDRPGSDLPFVMDELQSRQFRQAPAVIVLTGCDAIGDLDVTRGIEISSARRTISASSTCVSRTSSGAATACRFRI